MNALLVLAMIAAAPVKLDGDVNVNGNGDVDVDIGTNLAPISDWSTQRPFADLFKQSRAWISNTEKEWDDGRALDVDARGWVRSLEPGQRARALVAWDTGARVVEGDLVVTWRGKGVLDFWPQKRVRVDERGRRAVIHADGKSGVAINILATDPNDYVRDIRVSRAGNEGKRFDPMFLRSLERYSTLRFMDWARTNETALTTWKERAVVDDATWSTSNKGVPLEVMIELCNEADKDMWLSVPDTWNADAVERAAQLVAGFLEKERTLYVESSNEVWNDMFPQAARARERGLARKLSSNAHHARLLAQAERSVEVLAAFTTAWRARDRSSAKLVRVMGAQHANPWSSGVLLSAPGVAGSVDALAVGPYVGHGVKSTNVDEVFRELEASLRSHAEKLREHRRHAESARVKLIAYEGGQHLIASGPGGSAAEDARAAAFMAANRDPRMTRLYRALLATWKSAGGGLFVHYYDIGPHTKFGTWGARERVDQASSPKLDGLFGGRNR